ncbi:MAG: translational GTPase TypA [Candidatus Roizmanbacteria bacterium]|nr:translational GTPase TypA [Candidatus Roizmanbacteria bacterium]
MKQENIRNIAIIAHVDHGKTTLVDHLLKQAHVFAAHQAEMSQTTIMDSQDLERERGLTILAKNTAVTWNNHKINILDTPGHADFAGEVERVLSMVDGCLLLVDAAEGVLAQTKYVLSLAMKQGLKIIVLINKVDKKDQRSEQVLEEISNLFLEFAEYDSQLEFPVLYAIGREGVAGFETSENPDHSMIITDAKDLSVLFETVLKEVPAPSGSAEGGFQMQITNLSSDSHKGIYAIGKVSNGILKKNDPVLIVRNGEVISKGRAEYIFTYKGLKREEISETEVGDIIAITGVLDVKIGDTITDPAHPTSLPHLSIAEPTIQIELSVSNSPFVGRDGNYVTSRQLGERLRKELETNVGLRLSPGSTSESFVISGRGELHLTILIETMRREGYEFSVSRPQVIFKKIDGVEQEPWEEATIEVPEESSGSVITALGLRKGEMVDMKNTKHGVCMTYHIATRNLIGLRSELLKKTSGMLVFNSLFLGYQPKGADATVVRNGVVVSTEAGQTLSYSLEKVQNRAMTFVNPGEEVYTGMIVGQNSRQEDMYMNVCRGKKLTNMRAASGDDIIKLAPAVKMSLEECLVFLGDDELLEVTPKHLRLRKRHLQVKR